MTELLNVEDQTKSVESPIIKVIGVGGGGGNAVNYMYSQNIKNVSYLLCNTDRQHLLKCSVPNMIVLGRETTHGLGAGNDPKKACAAAEESRQEIEDALKDGTRMAFITAGMGGGTGTGAAPIIARIAKDLEILTIGIVTLPFHFEGRAKLIQSVEGVEELRKNVDAILVVKNQLLFEVYPDMTMTNAFRYSNETLTTSARSISELITIPALVNVDFADVTKTLKDGGVSIITRGFASLEEGIRVAIERALRSPLLNTTDFAKAKRVLFLMNYKKGFEPKAEMALELQRTTAKIQDGFEFIWGYGERSEEEMEDELGITILASGFKKDSLKLEEYAAATPEEQEKIKAREEQNQKLLAEWLGDDLKKIDNITAYNSYTPVIFTDEELDDESFIDFISETPAHKRREEDLARKRHSSSPSSQK